MKCGCNRSDMHPIPALRQKRQEDGELKISLGFIKQDSVSVN